MTFLQGLGFLGLIAIPILIIIYIIKPKFIERKISSTYVWKLSLKYRKRKLPLQWLKSFLLIVQCLVVAVIAFLLARPNHAEEFDTENYSNTEVVVFLDASASMNTKSETDGKTRFQRAIDQINELAKKAEEDADSDGDDTTNMNMTVIVAGDTLETIVSNAAAQGLVKENLDVAKCTGFNRKDYVDVVEEAIEMVEEKGSLENMKVILYTDQDFEGTDKETGKNGFVNVVNVSDNEWNFAIYDAWEGILTEDDDPSETVDTTGETILYVEAISYNRDVTITPCVDIEYMAMIGSEKTVMKKTVKLPSRELKAFDVDKYAENLVLSKDDASIDPYSGTNKDTICFDYKTIKANGSKLTSYKSLKFYFEDQEGKIIGETVKDSFDDDNIYYIFGGEKNNFKVQVVDGRQRNQARSFIFTALSAAGGKNYDVNFATTVAASATDASTVAVPKFEGFDLYVFDSVDASIINQNKITDGAVLIVNPTANSNYSQFGFTTSAEMRPATFDLAEIVQANAAHEALYKVNPEADTLKVKGDNKGVFSYTKYTQAEPSAAATRLLSTEDGLKSIVFIGTTDERVNYGVFSFDLSFTDFPLIFDSFPQLVKNLLGWSTNRTIEGDVLMFDIGDEIVINPKPNATKVEIFSGDGTTGTPVKTISPDKGEISLKYTVPGGGVYTIKQTLTTVSATAATEQIDKFFVRCDPDESNFNKVGDKLATTNPLPDMGETGVTTNVNYDDLSKYFAGALLLLVLLEWGLQYREQY